MKVLFKKPLSIILALAIIVVSISVIAYAVPDYEGTVSTSTKFYLLDENGETGADDNGKLYVSKGDNVRADVHITTDFLAGYMALYMVYNSDMLTVDPVKYEGFIEDEETDDDPVSNEIALRANIDGYRLYLSNGKMQKKNILIADGDGPFSQSDFSGLGTMYVYADKGIITQYDDTNLFSIYFTVNGDAEIDEVGTLNLLVGSGMTTSAPDLPTQVDYVTSSEKDGKIFMKDLGSTDYLTPDEAAYSMEIETASEEVLLSGTVLFETSWTSNGTTVTGTLATSDSLKVSETSGTLYVETGFNGDPAEIPTTCASISNSNYKFLGWATTANATEPEDVSSVKLSGADPVTLYAVYGLADTTYTVNVYEETTTAGHYENKKTTDPINASVGDKPTVAESDLSSLGYTIPHGFEFGLAVPAYSDTGLVLPSDQNFVNNVVNVYINRVRNDIIWKIGDDEIDKEEDVLFGADISGIDDPVINNSSPESDYYGYDIEWSDHVETMPADDITITGTTTPKTVIATFEDSAVTEAGTTVTLSFTGTNPVETTYGGTIAIPAFTVTDGYSVSGWKYTDANGETQTVTDGALPEALKTAYTFGENADGLTITFTPVVKENEGAVTFDANGGSFADANPYIVDAYTGMQITGKTPETAKSGTDDLGNDYDYDFLGWATASNATQAEYTNDTIPDYSADVTYYAVWADSAVTVTWDYPDDADETEQDYEMKVAPGTILTDDDVPFANDPTKEGNTWEWDIPDDEISDDTTITGEWIPETFTVKTFVDGEPFATYEAVPYNTPVSSINEFANPVKPDSVFRGWYSDEACTEDFDISTKVTEDLKLYGKFVDTVSVVFNDENGDPISTVDGVPVDEAIPADSIPEDPTSDGKTFKGWSLPYNDGENPVFIDPTEPLGPQLEAAGFTGNDVALTPVFVLADSYYIANGIDNDGNVTYASDPIIRPEDGGVTGQTYTVPGENDVIADEFKDALSFKGWSLTPNGTELVTPEGKLGEESAKYYAVYTVNSFNVTYKLDDGTDVSSTEVAFGGDVAGTQPADPTKEGYTFAGWKDADGKAPADYATMPAKDLTFTAQWTSNDVSAIFMSQNALGEYVTYKVLDETVGDPIAVPDSNPYKFGYKFTGWEDADGKAPEDYDGMPNETVTFYAQYELDKTFIAVVIGGAVVSGAVVGGIMASNAALITAAAIVGGIAVVAVATHTYKVTYLVDGDVYRCFYILEGTKIIVPADPTKDGYTFTGWDPEVPERMPAHDLVFEATFEPESGVAPIDDVIPDTGSATAGIAAFAVISSAAAAAFVYSRKKRED